MDKINSGAQVQQEEAGHKYKDYKLSYLINSSSSSLAKSNSQKKKNLKKCETHQCNHSANRQEKPHQI